VRLSSSRHTSAALSFTASKVARSTSTLLTWCQISLPGANSKATWLIEPVSTFALNCNNPSH
jgi:hypothetical protein